MPGVGYNLTERGESLAGRGALRGGRARRRVRRRRVQGLVRAGHRRATVWDPLAEPERRRRRAIRPGATRGGAHRGDRRGGRGEMRDDRCPRAHRRGPRAERHRGREGVREREARRRAGEAATGNRTWLRGRRRRSGGVARGPVDSTRVRDRLRGVRAERSLGGCVVEEADVRGGRRRHARVHLGARY